MFGIRIIYFHYIVIQLVIFLRTTYGEFNSEVALVFTASKLYCVEKIGTVRSCPRSKNFRLLEVV